MGERYVSHHQVHGLTDDTDTSATMGHHAVVSRLNEQDAENKKLKEHNTVLKEGLTDAAMKVSMQHLEMTTLQAENARLMGGSPMLAERERLNREITRHLAENANLRIKVEGCEGRINVLNKQNAELRKADAVWRSEFESLARDARERILKESSHD